MKTYNDLLHEHKQAFIQNDIPLETIKAFLFELCSERDIDLYLSLDEKVPLELLEAFEKGIERILKGEPMNQVLGYSWFFGYKLKVNGDVLIPRYETEELVGNILAKIDTYYNDLKTITLADIGTGSGAIAIALKKEEPRLKVYASDISSKALKVAKENASDNETEITFLKGDMLKPLIEKNIKLDILISNPPYIPKDQKIEASVKDFEPHVALFGGEDGLYFYKEIFKDAHKVLKENALLGFEIGYDQKEALLELAKEYFKDAKIEVLKDINSKDRMMFIKEGGNYDE